MQAYMNALTHTQTRSLAYCISGIAGTTLQSAPHACALGLGFRVQACAPPVYFFDNLCMYDILGREQRQGEQEAAGGKESTSLRMHNDVHRVSSMCGVKHVAVVSVG